MITTEYKKGRCVLNECCQHPDQELRPHHRCPDCLEIVHVLCGQFDETRDVYVCGCMMQPQKEDEGKMTANENHDVEQLCAKPLEEKEINKEIVSANSNENDDLQVTIQEQVSNEPNEERDDHQK